MEPIVINLETSIHSLILRISTFGPNWVVHRFLLKCNLQTRIEPTMGKAAYSSDDEATLYSPTSPVDDDKRDLLKSPPEKVHPVDTGLHAWLFLCASFLIEALALGETLFLPELILYFILGSNCSFYRFPWSLWRLSIVL